MHRNSVSNSIVGIILTIIGLSVMSLSDGIFTYAIAFGGIFLIAGLGSLYTAYLNYSKHAEFANRAAQYPDEPWRWANPDNAKQLASIDDVGVKTLISVTVGMTIGLILFIPSIFRQNEDKRWVAILIVIGLLCAIYFLAKQCRRKLRIKRLRRNIVCYLDTHPVVKLGGTCCVRLTMPLYLELIEIEASLAQLSMSRYADPFDSGTILDHFTDIEIDCSIDRIDSSEHQVYYLTADVPAGAPPTSWKRKSDWKEWHLYVKLNLVRGDVALKFEIPVANPNNHLSLGN